MTIDDDIIKESIRFIEHVAKGNDMNAQRARILKNFIDKKLVERDTWYQIQNSYNWAKHKFRLKRYEMKQKGEMIIK